jgi:hypothetical protein
MALARRDVSDIGRRGIFLRWMPLTSATGANMQASCARGRILYFWLVQSLIDAASL